MNKINQSAMWKIWHNFLHIILRLKKETGRYCAWQCWQQNFWELEGQSNRKLLSYTWNYNSWDIYIQLSFPSITLTRILVGWSKDDGRQKTTHVVEAGLTGMYDTLIHPWYFWWSMLKEWWASDPRQCESWKERLGKKRDEARTAMLTQERMPGKC